MKCQTPGCKNEAREKRHFCSSCTYRKWGKKNTLKYLYQYWRQNCHRRKKEFTIIFDQFKEFCEKTGYDKTKGIYANCFSIDRRDPDQGYHVWNIRSITVFDNSKLARGVNLVICEEFRMSDEPAPF